ncbi:MAG: hypothetical protein ACTSQJ_01630 [Promethearchaeota archaeon]
MLGNEAVVRGCLEAGVSFAAQYPGTPTSDIGETFQRLLREEPQLKNYLVHHWAINEAVATSECAGAAWTGCLSLNPMKHVGLNVASDALSVIAKTSVFILGCSIFHVSNLILLKSVKILLNWHLNSPKNTILFLK